MQTKLSNEIKKSKILYTTQKNKSLSEISIDYQNGEMNKYDFIKEMNEKYSVFFEVQKLLNERNIESMSIDCESLIVRLKENNLQFAVDKSCRSAIFELLNFGSYEFDEMQMIKNLLCEQSIIFDVGAHLGWYSISLAKQYKNSIFYAFEPMPNTFSFLKKNIALNGTQNVYPLNFGLTDQPRVTQFYYSEVGSAVASERDIFDINTLKTIECTLKTIDDFVASEKINKIDFIKCDVEGAEFLVIKGGNHSIRKFLPILFLELVEDWCNKFNYSISDVLKLLKSIGYNMFEIRGNFLYQVNKITSDKIDNFNFIFLHTDKHRVIIDRHTETCPQ
jgi:FkbM family methyltransferase